MPPPVVGPADDVTPCDICSRDRVKVYRIRTRATVVLCLACDPGPLAARVLDELGPRYRRALNL